MNTSVSPLGLLDRLPRSVRHLLIGLLVVLLTWATEDGLPAIGPWLADHPPLGPLAGAGLTQLLLYLTPLVRSYGVGRPMPAPDDAGKAFPTLLIGAAVLVLLAASAAPAVASATHPHRPAFGWVGVTCAEEVDPAADGSSQVLISYRLEDQKGHDMVPRVEDSGVLVRVEVHQVGSRYGHGVWAVLGHAAGEARWLAVVPAATQVDQVRVTRLDVGVTSVPWPIGGCSWAA